MLESGFGCSEFETEKADAIFLDLPRPQDALDHAVAVLKSDGRLCSFSPCVEQIVVTAKGMTERGFMDIQVVECMERLFSRKILRDGVSEEGNGPSTRTVFVGGQKEDRTHTGYLLFGTKYDLEI